MRDEQHGYLAFLEFHEFLDAPIGEDCIANGESFIDDQNLGVDVNRCRECQAHVHAGRIFFHWPIHERADFGEAFDLREHMFHVATRNAEDLAVQINVFATREFGIEPSAQFEQRSDSTMCHDTTAGRLQNAADDL